MLKFSFFYFLVQDDVIGVKFSLEGIKPGHLRKKEDEDALELAQGSWITFYKNGVEMSHAFN